ncbi:nucleotidyltransferase family protein [Agathobaculum sp.]|uniref:nucleotidyltransferase family protein n=1 Tax=Agathobaculum sp. TaxID=2048138 RepID=UPI002A8411A0|nr:nucleotidyltransferase domain-containing protein [Agathobaculum sp.]MDY3618792.1 nucleotidyltransferase domain-containing protein [Agathobaculum sp.]
MKRQYTIDEIREIVAILARQYGAQRVYLFGSYARGDAEEQSDMDLRIDKGAIRGLALAGLLVDLEDALGVPVDLIPTSSLDAHFLSDIHTDEVLLYEAS